NGAGGCRIRTRYYFGALKSAIGRHLAKDEYRFTFQTQSIFDASIPNTPHFVYTDHAEKECLNFPGFQKRDLFPVSWLDLEKSISDNAPLVFTMSNHIRQCLIDDYACPPEKVVSAGAGCNTAHTNTLEDFRRRGNGNILFVGRAWQPKGGPELVAAFRRVSQ